MSERTPEQQAIPPTNVGSASGTAVTDLNPGRIDTLVHDLTQPLSAIANYLDVALHLIERRLAGSPADDVKMRNAIALALAEVYRAGAIARQIRSSGDDASM